MLTMAHALTQVKKRVKSEKGAKGAKAKAFVTETQPCDSFFNTFNPPQVRGTAAVHRNFI